MNPTNIPIEEMIANSRLAFMHGKYMSDDGIINRLDLTKLLETIQHYHKILKIMLE